MHQTLRIVAIIISASFFAALGAGGAASPVAFPRHPLRPARPAGFYVVPGIIPAIAIALQNPTGAPNGTNVWSCKPPPQHPYPVVLVPATFGDMEDDYGALAPTLANAGYCVFSLNYGGRRGDFIQSIGPIAQSAQQVAAFIDRVRSATGVSQVDMVGHSQGGLLAEYYAKVLGGAANLHDIVALSPPTHGTSLDGFVALAQVFPGANQLVRTLCAACRQQETGSQIISQLDSGPIAQSGVSYTIVETTNEIVVTPVGSSFIQEPGVTNEWVQSQCPFDPVDHADLPYDQVVLQEVLNALDPSTAQPPNCFVEFPFPA